MALKDFPDYIDESVRRIGSGSVYGLRKEYCPTPKEMNAMNPILPNLFSVKGEMERQGLGTHLLIKYILECAASFNVARQMSPMQMENLAADLMDEYPEDPLTMFRMFFVQVRRGRFGEDFNRLDGPTFFRWYKQFRSDTIDIIGNDFRKKPDLALPAYDSTKSDMSAAEQDERYERLLKHFAVNQSKRDSHD